jgi:transmembrane sensor
MSVKAEAIEWMVRLEAGEAGPDALEAWLQSGPGRREALAEARRLWADLDWDATLNAEALAPAAPPQGECLRGLRGWARPFRLLPAGTGLAAAAAAVFALAVWNAGGAGPQLAQAPRSVHQTEVGEIRTVALPDGSSVTLGGRSTVTERFSGAGRLVDLGEGDALFDVAADDGRVFMVQTGPMTVSVLGTVFEINRARSRIQVSVLEGAVRAGAAVGAEVGLGAGGRAGMEPAGSLRRERFEPAAAARWRESRLVYRDAPLGRIIEDINRYHAPGVSLASRDLAVLRVTTSFRIDQLEAALAGIALSHGLEMERGGGGAFMLRHP